LTPRARYNKQFDEYENRRKVPNFRNDSPMMSGLIPGGKVPVDSSANLDRCLSKINHIFAQDY
jgi:hypothetical protein